jgi:NADH dehydrogenase FAD-containing subunit
VLQVTGVNTEAKEVMVGDEAYPYDKLLLATGSK